MPKVLVINSCVECKHRKRIGPKTAWGSATRAFCERMNHYIQSTGTIPRKCPLQNPTQEILQGDRRNAECMEICGGRRTGTDS